MRRLAILPLLGCLACGGSTPGGGDAGIDALVCADADGGLVAASDDVCDGVDNDCNGAVDDGPSITFFARLYRDADGDGLGDHSVPVDHACLRPGFVLPIDGVFDCDDTDPSNPPMHPERCDADLDGFTAAVDCDDHDALRNPTRLELCNGVDDDCDGLVDDADQTGPIPWDKRYSRDDDGDGFPTTVLFACSPPGNGFVADPTTTPIDCAPTDPAIHPDQLDDCATGTDINCDGVFRPVFASQVALAGTWDASAVEAGFLQAGPTDPPSVLYLAATYGGTVHLCPGTYRVVLSVTSPAYGGELLLRGHGATPADVVLDAAGAAANLTVRGSYDVEIGGATNVRAENLTFVDGSSTTGGCVLQFDPNHRAADVTLDTVVLRGCRASAGGAIGTRVGNALTLIDTTFVDTVATVSGGAIDFAGRSFSMTGGGFSSVSAPVGTGSAIAATLTGASTLDLVGVDLGAVTDDLAVTTTGAPILRDLGANATLHCDVATGCTP